MRADRRKGFLMACACLAALVLLLSGEDSTAQAQATQGIITGRSGAMMTL